MVDMLYSGVGRIKTWPRRTGEAYNKWKTWSLEMLKGNISFRA